jgi:hypothetical protein
VIFLYKVPYDILSIDDDMFNTPAEKKRAHKALVDNFWNALEEPPRRNEDFDPKENDYRTAWGEIVEFEKEAQKTPDIPYTKFDINARSVRHGQFLGFTPLCICVQGMFSERTNYLIDECKADVNAISDLQMHRTSLGVGVSPLHVAVQYAWGWEYSSLLIYTLLLRGANIFTLDMQGMTAFHRACRMISRPGKDNKEEVVHTFIHHTKEKSRLFSMKDSFGKTGLDYVVERFQPSDGDKELLEEFIADGADIGAYLDSDAYILTTAINSIEDRDGNCRYFSGTTIPTEYMLIKTLLLGGANPFKLSKNGNSSVTLAARLKNTNPHPATYNIKAMFVAIQAKKDTLIKKGDDRDINRDEIERIIEEVEETRDIKEMYTRRCMPWGQRLTGSEFEDYKNDQYIPEHKRRMYGLY